jgi:hypothetical protein
MFDIAQWREVLEEGADGEDALYFETIFATTS